MEDCISRNEYAVAASAIASMSLMQVRSIEADRLFEALPWDRGLAEKFGPWMFPDSPDEQWGRSAVQYVDRFFPKEGPVCLSSLSTFCYHSFELCVDPRSVDPDPLLKLLSEELQSRWLPGSSPLAFGPFVLGPLGVVEFRGTADLSREHGWLPTVPGSLAGYVDALCEEATGYCGASEDERVQRALSAWSSRWRQLTTVWRDSTVDYRRRVLVQTSVASSQTPAEAIQNARQKAYDKVCTKASSAVLQRVGRVARRELYGHDFKFAPSAHIALNRSVSGEEVDPAVRHQLLLLVSPSTAVSVARQVDATPWPVLSVTRSFVETLALIVVAMSADRRFEDQIRPYFNFAGGTPQDRALHWIVRYGPIEVLMSLIANPVAASYLGMLACAPLEYHSVDTWDPTSKRQKDELLVSIVEALGGAMTPPLNEAAMPLRVSIARAADLEQMRNACSSGRRRAEWLLKCAIRYLTSLSKGIDAAKPPTGSLRRSEWVDQTVQDAAHCYGHGEGLGVSELVSVSSALRKHVRSMVQESAVSLDWIKGVLEAHDELLRKLEEFKVASAGNVAAHDNPLTLDDCRIALARLRNFDEFARSECQAIPCFVRCTSVLFRPNLPVAVIVEPIGDFKQGARECRTEYFFSAEELGRLTQGPYGFSGSDSELQSGRILSFTDRTQNTDSINPIVVDWTDWVSVGRRVKQMSH